jgi:hypothetical protein
MVTGYFVYHIAQRVQMRYVAGMYATVVVCPYCGCEIQPDAHKCNWCGSAIDPPEHAIHKSDDDGPGSLFSDELDYLEHRGTAALGPYISVPKLAFPNFAAAIYCQKPNAHRVRFLLPALYGGELSGSDQQYEALFVLQDPSIGETERNWKSCKTPREAVQRHRSIFSGWAFKPKTNQCRLFQTFSATFGDPQGPFFERFYVTDFWKAGLGNEKPFWMGKLRIELREVRAKRIILVGSQALKARVLLRKGRKSYHIRFPYKRFSDYATDVAKLLQEIEKDES